MADEAVTAEALQLAENLRRAIGNFVRAVRSSTGTATSAQSETLGLLDRDGPMSVAEMAALRNVKHQSMRLVVAQLVAEGLLSLTSHPRDGRSKLVTITDEGLAVLSTSRAARAVWIAKALQEDFTAEERQSIQMSVVVLERLAEAGNSQNR